MTEVLQDPSAMRPGTLFEAAPTTTIGTPDQVFEHTQINAEVGVPQQSWLDAYGAQTLAGTGLLLVGAACAHGIAIRRRDRRYAQPIDSRLRTDFPELVNALSLEDILQLPEGGKIPKGLGNYSLVGLAGHYSDRSHYAARDDIECVTGEKPKYHYTCEDGVPYLDTGLALGLVYKGTLSAVAGAGVTHETGRLMIAQLQNVNFDLNAQGDKNAQRKNGLWRGFLWRHTLVQGWIAIAEQLDLEKIFMQCGENNRWKPIRRHPERYNTVARDMGFTRTRRRQDFVKTLV